MKKAFSILISFCIIGFVGFQVTKGIFGSHNNSSYVDFSGWYDNTVSSVVTDITEHITNHFDEQFQNSVKLLNVTVNSAEEWEIEEQCTDLVVESARAKVLLQEYDGDCLKVKTDINNGRKVSIVAKYNDNNALKIKIEPDISTVCEDKKIIILIPRGTLGFLNLDLHSGEMYVKNVSAANNIVDVSSGELQVICDKNHTANNFEVYLSSGKVYVENMTATENYIDVGSGTFEMLCDKEYPSETFKANLSSGKMYLKDVASLNGVVSVGSGTFEMLCSEENVFQCFKADIGSGKATMRNLHADECDMDVGSGAFNLIDYSGSGYLRMGSGKANIIPAEDCERLNFYMGSGSCDTFLNKTGADIKGYVSSGYVKVNAYGVDTKIDSRSDDESIVVGESATELEFNVTSGKVSVQEVSEAPEFERTIPELQFSGFEYTDTPSSTVVPLDPVAPVDPVEPVVPIDAVETAA